MSCGSSGWEASESDTRCIVILRTDVKERVECVCIEKELTEREKKKEKG
jgi:hypothetical protein